MIGGPKPVVLGTDVECSKPSSLTETLHKTFDGSWAKGIHMLIGSDGLPSGSDLLNGTAPSTVNNLGFAVSFHAMFTPNGTISIGPASLASDSAYVGRWPYLGHRHTVGHLSDGRRLTIVDDFD